MDSTYNSNPSTKPLPSAPSHTQTATALGPTGNFPYPWESISTVPHFHFNKSVHRSPACFAPTHILFTAKIHPTFTTTAHPAPPDRLGWPKRVNPMQSRALK